MTKTQRYLIGSFLALCILILFGALLNYRPSWGLIDDGNLLNSAADIRRMGFWNFTFAYIKSDLQWGMLRPYLPALILLVYGPFSESTLYAHTVNIVLVALAHFLFFFALIGSLNWKSLFSDEEGRLAIGRGAAAGLITLACFSFPWFHYYFAIPSLQEKVVILWAAASLAALNSVKPYSAGNWKFFLTLMAVIVAGILTKAQFLFFLPLMLAALWDQRGAPLKKIVLLMALFAVGGAGLKLLANSGSYTNSYGSSAIIENLRHSKSIYLFGLFSLMHAGGLWLIWRAKKASPSQIFAWLSPALCLLLFLALMLPWKLGGYLNVIATPFFAIMVSFWVLWCRPRRAQLALLLALGVGAISVTAIRAYQQYAALGSLRELVEASAEASWPAGAVQIWNSCNEGSGHIQHYFSLYAKRDDIKIAYADPATAPTNDMKNGYWIEQETLCPGLDSVKVAVERKLVLGKDNSVSFKLVHYHDRDAAQ